MCRYLLYISYLGTNFRGVVQTNSTSPTVQRVIEGALHTLKPQEAAKLYFSSRTDAGVHALNNTAHVDFVRRNNQQPFSGEVLKTILNNKLLIAQQDIRINDVKKVPDEFHARFQAKGRTYVYRIASNWNCALNHIPLFENHRCWMVSYRLDIEKMKQACEVFIGTHDFAAFRSKNNKNVHKSTVRTIDSINIRKSHGILQHLSPCETDARIEYYEIEFKAKSFLYKQLFALRFSAAPIEIRGTVVRVLTTWNIL
ncbi:tRNA pseudouridine synthase-like 1 [Saccoglossus kowalevskii]